MPLSNLGLEQLQFKKGDYGLREAKADQTNLQYLRAKQNSNQRKAFRI